MPLLVTLAAGVALPRVRATPAPLVPRIRAPASLVKFRIKPTRMPSVLPVMRPVTPVETLLVRVLKEEALSRPPMPLPVVAVMLPVLVRVLPVPRFTPPK